MIQNLKEKIEEEVNNVLGGVEMGAYSLNIAKAALSKRLLTLITEEVGLESNLLEEAFGIIMNAKESWDGENREWIEAAKIFRDKYTSRITPLTT